MQAYGEWLASNSGEGRRYSDPDPGPPSDPAELDSASIRRFAGLFGHDHDDFPEFLGSFLSRYRLAHEPLGPEEQLGRDDLATALVEGRILRHNPWTRLLWLQRGEDALLFGAGSVYTCDLRIASVVCNEPALAAGGRELAEQHSSLICKLVNDGHLYLEFPS
jgi:50S ribosomal protein L16 3-hydroxylase